MRLIGKDFDGVALVRKLEAKLKARGLQPAAPEPISFEGIEPRVDPLSFNLSMLDQHADPTRALPLETHRSGFGRAVLLAKWGFRQTCQVFINETLSRQRLFNGHVRDSYAQLSAEVLRLRHEVEELRSAAAPRASAATTKPRARKPAKR